MVSQEQLLREQRTRQLQLERQTQIRQQREAERRAKEIAELKRIPKPETPKVSEVVQEQTIQVPINKGGSKVTLTLSQEQRAQEIAAKYLAENKISKIRMVNEPKAVLDRAVFLAGTRQAGSFIAGRESYQRAQELQQKTSLPEGAIASSISGGYIYAEGKEPYSKMVTQKPQKIEFYGEVQPSQYKFRQNIPVINKEIDLTKGVGRYGAETAGFVKSVGRTAVRAATLDPTLAKDALDITKGVGSYVKEKGSRLVKGKTVFPEIGETAYKDPVYSTLQFAEVPATIGAGTVLKTKIIPDIAATTTKYSKIYKPVEEVKDAGKIIKDVPLVTEKEIPALKVEGLGTAGDLTTPVKTRERVQIGLIPGGKGQGGQAFKTGAYGFTKEEQAAFIGKETIAGTTARGLTKSFGRTTKIKSFEKGIDPLTGKERDFGAFFTPQDPTSGVVQLRASRLKRQKGASFYDIIGAGITDDVTLKGKGKPQFVLAKGKVGEEFTPFGRGLKKDVPTGELELELGVGKRLRPIEKSAVTVVNKQRVPIISAKIEEAGEELTKVQLRAQRGEKLTSKEKRIFKQQDPLGYSEYSSRLKTGKRLDITGLGISPLKRLKPRTEMNLMRVDRNVSKVTQPSKTTLIRTTAPSTTRFTPTTRITPGITRITTPTTRITPPVTTTTFITTPPGKTPPIPKIRTKEPFKPKQQRKSPPYDLFVRDKGKYVKVENNIPYNDALSIGSYLSDNTTSARFKVVRDRGKVTQPKIKVPGDYFFYNQQKFRDYKIRKGKKIPLQRTLIEKRNVRIDTSGEKRQLSLAKAIKGLI